MDEDDKDFEVHAEGDRSALRLREDLKDKSIWDSNLSNGHVKQREDCVVRQGVARDMLVRMENRINCKKVIFFK